MLIFLDNVSNVKGVPQENYARELMEQHTLGVDGGYTQDDVKEVRARLRGRWSHRRTTGFIYRTRSAIPVPDEQHDDGRENNFGH